MCSTAMPLAFVFSEANNEDGELSFPDVMNNELILFKAIKFVQLPSAYFEFGRLGGLKFNVFCLSSY